MSEQVEAALRLAYAALKQAEWGGFAGDQESHCPVCISYRGADRARHAAHCDLPRALAAIRALLPDVETKP